MELKALLNELARLSEENSKGLNATGAHLITPQIEAGMRFVQMTAIVNMAVSLERIADALEEANAKSGGASTDGALG